MKQKANNWSLTDELCKVAGVKKISDALHLLGLLNAPTASFHLINFDNEWRRGGAETYIYRFQIEEEPGQRRDVLLKACVAYAPGGSLDGLLRNWIDRRNLLSATGIQTPKLYGWGHGLVIEEFVQYQLVERLKSGETPRKSLLGGLAKYAAALSKLGFAPVEPFADLRSRGDDIVVVDFGQDLGPPDVMTHPRPAMFSLLLEFLHNLGVRPNDGERDEMRGVFALAKGEHLH